MAGESEQKIVWVSEQSAVTDAIQDIDKETLIAVDSEGFNLGRNGTLDILAIAKRDKTVYLFDITTMGQGVFEGGLKELLEGDKCEKLMFDGRNDADVLFHKHQVKLGNLLDLQLLDVVHRQSKNGKKHLPANRTGEYWNAVLENVDVLWGYKKCIEEYLKDKELVSIKERGTKEMNMDRKKNVWAERPLKDTLKQYCAVDTVGMFSLFDLLSPGKDLNSIRVASGRYADYIRSYPALPHNTTFVFHAYLPHNILSVDGLYRNCECIGCRKMFARDEYSKNQLRNRCQLCRVCKLIKKTSDVAMERLRAWEKQREYDERWIDSDDYSD